MDEDTGQIQGRIAYSVLMACLLSTTRPTAHGIADAGLAQVDPERPEVDGFAVEKAHVR